MTLANRRILWYAPISDYIRHASEGILCPFVEVRNLSYTAQRKEHYYKTLMELDSWGQPRNRRRRQRYPILRTVTKEGTGVTMEDVIERARELYPDLTLNPVTARKWTERGLLPSPDVQHRGGTQGNRADYPIDAAAQMATAGYLQDQGFRQKQIALARKIVLEGVPVDDDSMRDVVALLEIGRLEADGPNVFRLPSAEVAGIAKAVHAYAFALATARAGRNVTRPLSGFFHKRTWEKNGVQMFACFVSVLGYYIDPRGKDDITGLAADLDRQIRQKREEIQRNTDF
jgi:hypothetical protein